MATININEKELLFSCIYQLLFIHFILFINRIKHGDMHMKNIKLMKSSNQDHTFLKYVKLLISGIW